MNLKFNLQFFGSGGSSTQTVRKREPEPEALGDLRMALYNKIYPGLQSFNANNFAQAQNTANNALQQQNNLLRNLKTALRYKDRAAIKRYLKEYAQLDRTKKGLQQSMKAMNPLHGLSKEEQKQFLKWITADDRKYLQKANKYFHAVADRFIR